MSLVNKKKQQQKDVVAKIAAEKNISVNEAEMLFNALSQKKKRKLIQLLNS